MLPNDLDLNLHMNNGRYLTLLDLGRIEMMIRLGLGPVVRKNRWNPVVASQKIAFLRALSPFQQFTIRTRIPGWDDKWLYFHQTFEIGGDIYADAVIKTIFLSPKGRVPSEDLIRAIGADPASPPLPPEMLRGLEQGLKPACNTFPSNHHCIATHFTYHPCAASGQAARGERLGVAVSASKTLLIFIHGLGGSEDTTWGKFPELVADDAQSSPPAMTLSISIT